MAVQASAVGQRAGTWRRQLDARWLMAYAAGVGQTGDDYFDTTRDGGVVAHPVFPVAPEWGLLTDPATAFDLGLERSEKGRGVHAGHDLFIHRPLRQGTDVVVDAFVAGIEPTSAGARLTVRFDAVDGAGEPLWTTWMRSIYLGADVEGDGVAPADPPAEPPVLSDAGRRAEPVDQRVVDVAAGAAHVYTECARIWNPIHTDISSARRAGLAEPILHGTASFALGVNHVLDVLGAGPAAVRRLGCSFRAMVVLPSAVTSRVLAVEDTGGTRQAAFEVRNAAGDTAVRDGFVVVDADG